MPAREEGGAQAWADLGLRSPVVTPGLFSTTSHLDSPFFELKFSQKILDLFKIGAKLGKALSQN